MNYWGFLFLFLCAQLVRETAIQCLVAMSELPHARIYPLRIQVSNTWHKSQLLLSMRTIPRTFTTMLHWSTFPPTYLSFLSIFSFYSLIRSAFFINLSSKLSVYMHHFQVLRAISKALDDPKSAVRREAVRCRQAWLVFVDI